MPETRGRARDGQAPVSRAAPLLMGALLLVPSGAAAAWAPGALQPPPRARASGAGATILPAAVFSSRFPAGGIQEESTEDVPPERPPTQSILPPLFASDTVVRVVLTADFPTLRREDRQPGAPERPAAITWGPAGLDTTSTSLEVRTRGVFRLDRRNCDFPPLRLDFRTSDFGGTLFEGQDKLKLVVPCRPGRDVYEQYVLLEYLVYRMYAAVTDRSFRARLASIDFVDATGQDDTVSRYAFLIEEDDALASRLGGRVLEPPPGGQVDPRALDVEQATLFEVFQYLVGNTDWHVVVLHNVEVVFDGEGRVLPVPYDFDVTGFVDPPYAVPSPSLNLSSLRERRFRGTCRGGADYGAAFRRIEEVRGELEAVILGMEPLEKRRRERAVAYLDEFFRDLRTPERAQARFSRECEELRLR